MFLLLFWLDVLKMFRGRWRGESSVSERGESGKLEGQSYQFQLNFIVSFN